MITLPILYQSETETLFNELNIVVEKNDELDDCHTRDMHFINLDWFMSYVGKTKHNYTIVSVGGEVFIAAVSCDEIFKTLTNDADL